MDKITLLQFLLLKLSRNDMPFFSPFTKQWISKDIPRFREPIKTLSTDLVNTNVYYLTCGVYFGVRACDIFSLFRWLMLILEYFSYKGWVVVMAACWHILMDEGTTEKHLEIQAEVKICKWKKDYFNIEIPTVKVNWHINATKVEPAGKYSFVWNHMDRRLMGRYGTK